jgi:hypothetical protein
LVSRCTDTAAAEDPACWMPAMRAASKAAAALAIWVMFICYLSTSKESACG